MKAFQYPREDVSCMKSARDPSDSLLTAVKSGLLVITGEKEVSWWVERSRIIWI